MLKAAFGRECEKQQSANKSESETERDGASHFEMSKLSSSLLIYVIVVLYQRAASALSHTQTFAHTHANTRTYTHTHIATSRLSEVAQEDDDVSFCY